MATAPNPVTETERQTIVDMYKNGVKLAEITRVTGRPRPTIYTVLQREGVHLSRKSRPTSAQSAVGEVLNRYRDCIAEKTRLEEDCDRQRAEIDHLRAALDKGPKGVDGPSWCSCGGP